MMRALVKADRVFSDGQKAKPGNSAMTSGFHQTGEMSNRSLRSRTESPTKIFGYGKFATGDWARKLADWLWPARFYGSRRRMHGRLRGGTVGHFSRRRKRPTETALGGWGARIRTWEWRNQNPVNSDYLSTCVPKKLRKCDTNYSMAYPLFRNDLPPVLSDQRPALAHQRLGAAVENGGMQRGRSAFVARIWICAFDERVR
jgi:hypothetical protein